MLIAFIILEILLLLGVNHHHNIGDDFAMYLQQSKNIFYGIPQWDNYFIFNSDYLEYAPKAYPIGFPLLLSPIWYFSPNQIIAAKVLLSLCFCLFIFLLYKCGKNEKQGVLSTFLFTSICGMVFYILDLESNILADLFLSTSVLGLWILLLYKKEWTKNESILIFIICAISYLLKSIGIYFIFFFSAYFLIKSWNKDGFTDLFRTLFLIGLLLLLILLVNYMINYINLMKHIILVWMN